MNDTETAGEPAAKREVAGDRPLIEVGWIIAGRLDDVDWEAVRDARDWARQFWETHLPEFRWEMPLVLRDELVTNLLVEPIDLLEHAVTERNLMGWDFCVIITGAVLNSHYRSGAVAAISRTLESAVISTRRIDPRSRRLEVARASRVEAIQRRVAHLVIHTLGHLAGLDHEDDPENYLYHPRLLEEIDLMRAMTEKQWDWLREELRETANERLEEREPDRRQPIRFYVRAIWLNLPEIADAVVESKPWSFPFRLSRLTAAAVSTLLVLTMTAEAWDLGMTQSVLAVSLLSSLAVLGTTTFILMRQQLYLRRDRPKLSEQVVVTNIATTLIVFLGMATTYGLLGITNVCIGLALFPPAVVREWAASVPGDIGVSHHLILSAFVASLGVCLGALGASFEHQQYFRHIALVDEEI